MVGDINIVDIVVIIISAIVGTEMIRLFREVKHLRKEVNQLKQDIKYMKIGRI